MMSAVPQVATEFLRRAELSRWAISGLTHCSKLSLRKDRLAAASPNPIDSELLHSVFGSAAGELRGNRLRPGSLRRARSRRDLDPARPLELRQQLRVRASESAGYQNLQLRRLIRHLCHAGGAASARSLIELPGYSMTSEPIRDHRCGDEENHYTQRPVDASYRLKGAF
jgi:hypothetical protein